MTRLPWVWDDGGRSLTQYRAEAPGDCVCRAIAIVLHRPYQEVYDELAEACKGERRVKGRRPSHPRTGVARPIYDRYLREAGLEWEATMGIGTGCQFHLRAGEVPMVGAALLRLSRHITAVVDGVIRDTYDPSRDGTRCVYGWYS